MLKLWVQYKFRNLISKLRFQYKNLVRYFYFCNQLQNPLQKIHFPQTNNINSACMRRESSYHFPKTEFQPPLPKKQSNMHHFIPSTLKPKIYKKKKKTIIQNLDMNRYRLELTLGVNAKSCSRMPNNMKEWVSKNNTNTIKLLYLLD